MDNILGERLQQWRRGCNLSVEAVARQAKIAPSTLRRWENGTFQPQVSALKEVLKTLHVSETEQQATMMLLDAPRAVAACRVSTQKEEELACIPSTGDLWRAMRMRAGLTGKEVAAALHIDAGRVSKWERSLISVPEERLEDLFTLLGADMEEQKELSSRRLTLSAPLNQQSVCLDQYEALMWMYAHKIKQGEPFSADLRLLTLESQLWLKALLDPHALNLLRHIWVWHADYLLWRGRLREMHTYATRTLETGTRTPPLESYCVSAVRMCARFAVEKHSPQGYREAIQLLTDIPSATSRPNTVCVYRDMASYYAELGKFEEALQLVRSSRQIAIESSNQPCISQADFIEGRTLVKEGRAQQALPLLHNLPWTTPNERLLVLHILAQAYIQLRQGNEAMHYMSALDNLIASNNEHQRWRLRELERQI